MKWIVFLVLIAIASHLGGKVHEAAEKMMKRIKTGDFSYAL